MKEKQDKKPKKKSITKSNAKPGEPGPKKKKANVLKVAEIEDQIEMVEKVEHICILCERNRPVFLVDSDDQILRMQERFLPPFLKNLKQDFVSNKQYLKYLKITSKLISVCDCEWKKCHSYCATAFVLRTQKIYCRDCYTYFYLYVKSQRLFTGELLTDIAFYLIRFIVIIGFIYGTYVLDNYLKNEDASKIYA